MAKKKKHEIPAELAKKHNIILGGTIAITIKGKLHKFRAIKARGDIYICPVCVKAKDDVPLILIPYNSNLELDVCFECGEKLGLLQLRVNTRQMFVLNN